jgi:NHL repeat-containing protein
VRAGVVPGPARPELVEQGWRQFLVKVHNSAGVIAELRPFSRSAKPLFNSPGTDLTGRWLDMQMFNSQPLQLKLSGLGLEYRIIELYSRDAGMREAPIAFNWAQGEQVIPFDCVPSAGTTLRVRDEHGQPATAAFVIRDGAGRVYPSQAKRLAPGLAFQPQVYRADGETVKLPAGDYTIDCTRRGTARGQVYIAAALAVDTAGNLYVAEGPPSYFGSRVQKRNPMGSWSVIATYGGDLSQVFNPSALAVDTVGNLYLVDGDATVGRIQQRDAQGGWSEIAPDGSGLGQVSAPGALAMDTTGNLYVADTGNNRVLEYTPLPGP